MAPPSKPDAAAWAAGALGHAFADVRWLEQALTHASAGQPDYQRLEFVGDRLLALSVAAWLYETGDDVGAMARRLAVLVDRDSCAAVARELGVPDHIRLDKGARGARVHQADNILADVAEALIGAVYMDAGWEAAQAFVRRAWGPRLETHGREAHPKARLQEWALARGFKLPAYEVVARDGPDHAPRFRVAVAVTGQPPAEAAGASKADAERAAAAALLARLGL